MGEAAVDEYLAAAPEPHRTTLAELRTTLREILPHGEEAISYDIPAVKVHGKVVAGYAHFKNHCSYFPHSGKVLPEMGEELADYSWSAGTLRFPIDRSLPAGLVRRLVELRLSQLGF